MIDFNLDIRSLVPNDIINIVDNYHVLHFDEFPILYIGSNKFGNKVIGSHLDEFDDARSIFALHTIISNKEYHQFMNHKISYLEILKNSNSICLVDKDFSFNTRKAYLFDFNSIPQSYLPTNKSFCPISAKAYSLQFSISLKGKLADLNKAIADEVSSIQNIFTEFLEDRVKFLKGFDLIPKALLQPYEVGSFKINFELNLKSKNTKRGRLFIEQSPIQDYISEYVKYISDNFINDKEIFINETTDFSYALQNLENTINNLYENSYVPKPDNIRNLFKDDIIKSAQKFEKITEHVGQHFENVSILNIQSNNDESTLAYIDSDFSNNFQSIIEDIEISKKGFSVDDIYKDYNIYIYHLNTDNRTGNAFIKNIDNHEEMSKPKIKIIGESGLDQTKYTESLYLNKWINVKAKARKVGGKFTFLEIEYED